MSRLGGRLSARRREWRERPVDGAYAYLFLDGIPLRVWRGGASEWVSVLVAIDGSEEGFREVLACWAGLGQSDESRRALLRESSTERGRNGV